MGWSGAGNPKSQIPNPKQYQITKIANDRNGGQ
jgi:hypothetical protein